MLDASVCRIIVLTSVADDWNHLTSAGAVARLLGMHLGDEVWLKSCLEAKRLVAPALHFQSALAVPREIVIRSSCDVQLAGKPVKAWLKGLLEALPASVRNKWTVRETVEDIRAGQSAWVLCSAEEAAKKLAKVAKCKSRVAQGDEKTAQKAAKKLKQYRGTWKTWRQFATDISSVQGKEKTVAAFVYECYALTIVIRCVVLVCGSSYDAQGWYADRHTMCRVGLRIDVRMMMP